MGKTAKKRRLGEAWTSADHADRKAKRQLSREKKTMKKKPDTHPPQLQDVTIATPTMTTTTPLLSVPPSRRQQATAIRTRDSQEKRDTCKLRLHITKVQRQLDALKVRLQSWDPIEEAKRQERERRQLEEEEKRKQLEEQNGPPKKKGRKGPETWKLRGAARPAWEVYDFDTRHVDPHLKAHEDAKHKAVRVQNIFNIYQGRFGQEQNIVVKTATVDEGHNNKKEDMADAPPQPFCRQYLSLLMQLGLLCLDANKIKSATTAFEECHDLDGTEQPITNARCRLMRLYLQSNQLDSARQLVEQFRRRRREGEEMSAWICYSDVWMEYKRWKEDRVSSRRTAETKLAHAIRTNIFGIYYLAFHQHFRRVMEYTEDIEDAPEGTLEEAIEYCCSEQMSLWTGTKGALPWVRSFLGRARKGNGTGLASSELNWNDKLEEIEKERDEEIKKENLEAGDDDGDDEEYDPKMFIGMFRTAMEMLTESGEMNQLLDSAVTADIIVDDEEPIGNVETVPAATVATTV